jgi:methylthioribose-1-phosphate isomerase
MVVETLRWEGALDGHVVMLEQTLLPHEELRISVSNVEEMVAAIYRLAVRGAPAIGIAGAYGLVLGIQDLAADSPMDLLARAQETAAILDRARPTAVNLRWALQRMLARAEREYKAGADVPSMAQALLEESLAIHREDAEQCQRMGEIGADYIKDGMTLMTHCNAGALATGGIGTALAPMYVAHGRGLKLQVFADETRPLLQGARITAWELARAGIDVSVLVDGAAGGILASGRVDAVFVGSDRIASNGDVCNKVGTYGLAVLAQRHAVPFYVVAPRSTFDAEAESGADIPIEMRPEHEVAELGGKSVAAPGARIINPAFDVTPAELVTAIVTEVGALENPNADLVREALARP